MKLFQILLAFTISLVLAAPAARAQQSSNDSQSGATTPLQPLTPAGNDTSDNANPPTPAARGLFVGSDDSTSDSSQAIPDTHVLSDSEALGLGQLQGPHNIFSPSLFVSQGVYFGLGDGGIDALTQLGGSLVLNRFWGRSSLMLEYDGAKEFSTPDTVYDKSYHNLNVTQQFQWQRWTLSLIDSTQFSPQLAFGGLNTGGPGLLGQIYLTAGLLPSLLPGENIETSFVERLQETAAVDLDYRVGQRSTITFSGSSGWLHFLVPGFVDTTVFGGHVGYNYSLDPKDSIAVIYGYMEDTFRGSSSQIRAHSVQGSFGRKVTGRLALQAAAGPQYISFANFGSVSSSEVTWTAFGSLTYQWPRTGLMLSYSHGLSGGSGVFPGALADSTGASLNHRFTANWSGSVSAGYSRSKDLLPTPSVIDLFDFWTASANLNRQIGRSLNVIFGYGLMKQLNSGGTCPVASCGFSSLLQQANVTVNWHLIPIPIH